MMALVPLQIFAIAPAALLSDHRPHGDALVAFGFLREMASRGHEIHVAAFRVDLLHPPPSRVHVHLLHERPRSGPLPPRAVQIMVLRRLFRRLGGAARFDVAHQLNPVDAGLSLSLAGEPVPVVLGPYVPDWPRTGPGSVEAPASGARSVKRLVRAAQQRAARVVLLSTEAAGTKLTGRGAGSTIVRVLPPGIDDELWSPAAADAGGEGDPVVLFLANLRIRKGVMVLLDAFERLAAQRPDVRLRIGGSGPLEGDVQRRVAASRARDRIELLGHVERARAPDLIRGGDVFCAPSFAEPFGMSVLEAMACGRPVVATDAGGTRHLVGGDGGRLVPPGDAAALAAALGELVADPGLRRRMGTHNRRTVEQRFSWSRVGDRLEAAYAEAVGEGSGGRAAPRARSAPVSA
jgi:glycosyltransferase involved in cell wall biosynthesis